MNKNSYKFNMDRRTYYFTLFHFLVTLLMGLAIYLLYEGGLLSVWFASCVGALFILMALSIPRSVDVTDDSLMINCLLDVTQIEISQISSIRKISPSKIRWVVPLFGSCGFFGYFGHFFDLRHMRRVTLYASEMRYLVEIVDIYEDHYYISCRERDNLITEVNIKLALKS